MITALNHELTTWLGYLQRGSVLIQVGLFVEPSAVNPGSSANSPAP